MVRLVPVTLGLMLWAGVTFAIPSPPLGPVQDQSRHAAVLHKILRSGVLQAGTVDSLEARRAWRRVARFYRKRGYVPAWSDGWGGFRHVDQLLRALRKADRHGLDPDHYPIDDIEAAVARGPRSGPRDWAKTDILLSYVFVTYAKHIHEGRVDPTKLEMDWYIRRPRPNYSFYLEKATSSGHIRATLHSLAPRSSDYGNLQAQLVHYQKLAAEGRWPTVGGTFHAMVGDSLAAVSDIRRLLQLTGDLPPCRSPHPHEFDALLADGVKSFQARHGITVDGVVGPQTLAWMRVTPARKIIAIRLNMERWRWIPDNLGERYVAVNIPAYRLYAVDDLDTLMTMRVIAGALESPTALFGDEITYMELNPEWNVPESIATEEVVPKVVEDPEYLLAQNIAVYDTAGVEIDPLVIDWSRVEGETLLYRFTQAPGVLNPLGTVKFMLPNPFSIYLHDTSRPDLFRKDCRSFSHGCIRLERPIDFADYLLRDDPKWTGEEVEAAIKTGKRRWIHLPEAMPIYLLYLTAFVDADGSMAFRWDVYGHDQTLADALRDYVPPYAPPEEPVPDLSELQLSEGR